MEVVRLGAQPPLAVLLLHLGACSEPIAWAGSRPISEATLAACPNPEWKRWMAKSLRVNPDSPWETWASAAKSALAGIGYGYGYGYGYGSGSGYGHDLIT